jgi:hypothetical protein
MAQNIRSRAAFSPARAAIAAALLLALLTPSAGLSFDSLPSSLTDQEFWSLSQKFSEPDGYFRSNSGSPDNLLSNETSVSTVATLLAARVKPSGVYLGVGPEQNFTYIAAIKPRIAIVTDIRRGNLQLHLMYKALFEMSPTRAEFVGRLFNRRRPAGLSPKATVDELMSAYLAAEPLDEPAFAANLKAITDHLTHTRRLPLDAADLEGIEYVARNFHRFGPAIHYTSSIGAARTGSSYASLMTSTDRDSGSHRTYLATEESYGFVRAMEQKNLVVPIVGDFAGPKALRAVGAYLKSRGAIVSAFYVSNVEMYLRRNGVWQTFCANVATLPLDGASTFIRPTGNGSGSFGDMAAETASCLGTPRE